MHAYVWEHIFTLYYLTAWWIFMKLGRDEVLMVPHIYFGIWARSTQGWIKGGAKIGHGGPLLHKTSSDQKATATNQMNSNDLNHVGTSVDVFGSIRKSIFWRIFEVFLGLDILVSFNAISIDFIWLSVLSTFILCSSHVHKWENADIKDLYAWRISMI